MPAGNPDAVNAGRRLLSLDALRGADMLFIMGFGVLVRKTCAALGHAECGLARQFTHVAWDGLHFEDTIFPLFRVIGMNAITIYLAQAVVSFGSVSNFFLGWAAGFCPAAWGAVVLQVGYVAACWLLLRFLDRHGIYLKV